MIEIPPCTADTTTQLIHCPLGTVTFGQAGALSLANTVLDLLVVGSLVR